MSDLLELAEAQARLLALAMPGECEIRPIETALGYYLAEDINARRTQPSHALSAMDGWAMRQADMPGPWAIIGESAAGHPFGGSVGPGEAVRISTGAVLPNGADMVLVQEQCTASGEELRFSGDPPSPLGRHIRARGLDFTAGETVLRKGACVTAASLALAVSAGHTEVRVHAAPKIAIIDSGDELALPGRDTPGGHIPASNGPMLTAMLSALPSTVRRIGPVPDEMDALRRALNEAGDADLVITTGGASVGDHDLVRPALESIGARIDFWRVAIKPGKPIMVAENDGTLFLGLPGNPVSAFVTATLFALPLVRAMLGAGTPLPRCERGTCLNDLQATGKRAEFPRARQTDQGLALLKTQDSGALMPLAMADALIVRPAHTHAATPGEAVEFIHI